MEFCPKCGGIMIPSKSNNITILKCSKCGFEKKIASKKADEAYKINKQIDRSLRTKTTSRISESPHGLSRSKDEIEQEKEEYYEIFLDLVREEEESGEEEY